MSNLYVRYSEATDKQLLDMLWHYEHGKPNHHVADCTLRHHADLTYCLDCHSDVYNAREELRRRGINQYPEDWTPPT